MVFRRDRARSLLLRAGDDRAPTRGWSGEGRDLLPGRSNHGAAKGLAARHQIARSFSAILRTLRTIKGAKYHEGF